MTLRAAALAAALAVALAPTQALADHAQESIFQDDNHLIYASTATVDHVLGVLQSLGVDRVRITALWSSIAPEALSHTRPAGFDAADPADYPAANWAALDRVVVLAEQHGIGVDFNVTAPGPLWATPRDAPRDQSQYAPAASEFGAFVAALGKRYGGDYDPARASPSGRAIPRVHYWTIWNEPNYPGWLAPQARTVGGRVVEYAPRLYRHYVDAAYRALAATGHGVGRDTILIGELSPEGVRQLGRYQELPPMRFVRALYCVDGNYRPLSGRDASRLGCPSNGRRFAATHPGLFRATGFAHHPYGLFFPPDYGSPNRDFVPIANLQRLELGLDRAFRAYGVRRQLPIYLTEYGYQTNPPDIYQVVTPAQQPGYLNESDYMAWRDPRVRAVAQFLLYDDRPDRSFASTDFKFWATFQTGLLFAGGRRKPAFAAYRLPIWVPSPRVARGGRMLVWGQLRAAPDSSTQRAQVQWRGPGGRYRPIALVKVSRGSQEGYFTIRVRVPGSGAVRLAWGSQTSRSVAVTVG